MDPVIRAMDRLFYAFALWWVQQSDHRQQALVVCFSLSASVVVLKIHDHFIAKACARVLEDVANLQAGPILRRIQESARAEAESQDERIAALEQQMRERLRQMESRLIDQRVPLQLLVNSSQELELLRKYLDSRPPMDVRRHIDVPSLVPPLTSSRATAYDHLGDDE